MVAPNFCKFREVNQITELANVGLYLKLEPRIREAEVVAGAEGAHLWSKYELATEGSIFGSEVELLLYIREDDGGNEHDLVAGERSAVLAKAFAE